MFLPTICYKYHGYQEEFVASPKYAENIFSLDHNVNFTLQPPSQPPRPGPPAVHYEWSQNGLN